jgi:hypothetical protein
MIKTIGGGNLEKLLVNIKSKKPIKMSAGFYPENKYPDGKNVAEIAYYNEYGFGIPERPFFRHGNTLAIKDINKMLSNNKDSNTPKLIGQASLNAIGETWVNNIKKSISGSQINYAPNSAATIAKKGSSKPLVDTGRLLSAPSFKIGDI